MGFTKTIKCLPVLCFILLIIPEEISAQKKNKAQVRGRVREITSQKGLEYVNVTILDAKDSAMLDGAITNDKGEFILSELGNGEYFIQISFMGFEDIKSHAFAIDPNHQRIDLGNFELHESQQQLKALEITAERSTFNNSIDRKIFNIGQDLMSKSGSLSDLLQNIPSIQVDVDGNVSLRGSENVLILINGKPSLLMGKNRASVLQQMPANSIERIEVITNPSARFKPDGTSGIINIVLKKNAKLGLNGSLIANAGNSNRYNSTLSFNYNPGKLNFFGNIGLRQDNRKRRTVDNRLLSDTVTHESSPYYLNNSQQARPISQIAYGGLDYKLDDKNKIGLSSNYNHQYFTRRENTTYNLMSKEVVTSDYDRTRLDFEYETEKDLTIYYEHAFKKEDHQLRFDFYTARQFEQEDNHYSNIYRTPVRAALFDNTIIQQGTNLKQLYAEYTNPISENTKLEAGYIGEWGKNDLNFFGEYFNADGQIWVKDLQKTNRFLFNQNIQTLYGTFSHNFTRFSFSAGLRAENVIMRSYLVTLDSIVQRVYNKLYPTLHLSYKVSDESEFQLNYSKRINRPEGDNLNPFPEYRDPRNLRAGNPYLKPEMIHSIELGYHWKNDNVSILPSVYYRYKYNGFTQVTTALNDSTWLTTNVNLSNDQSAGFELITSFSVGKYLTLNASSNAFYNSINASNLGYSSNKSIITWNARLSANVNLPTGTFFQLNTNYRAASLTPQGRNLARYVLNLGVRQDMLKKKVSLVVTLTDALKTLQNRTQLNVPWMDQNVSTRGNSRIIYLGITYYFGSPAKKSKDPQYDDKL